jgi:uncharacterized protein (TIGR00251 family)
MSPDQAQAPLKLTETASGVVFTVHVQPRASRNELCGLHDGELRLRLTSPPVDDAANKLCVEFLARLLGVAKSRVRIVAGARSRHKNVAVEGVSGEDVRALLT